MGGLICHVRREAILKFRTVPTTPPEQAQFDAQIRTLYAAPDVAESVVSDAPSKVAGMCNILAQESFSQADRQELLAVIESLYESYA